VVARELTDRKDSPYPSPLGDSWDSCYLPMQGVGEWSAPADPFGCRASRRHDDAFAGRKVNAGGHLVAIRSVCLSFDDEV